VLIAANVTDNTAVGTVTVAVRDAGGALVGNFTMVFNAGTGRYEYSAAFLELGVNSYTIWATDTSMNVASASGTFTIVDTTDPVLVAATATPNPVEVGAAVGIRVNATDLTLTSVRVAIRDPSNVVVGNFTMALASGVYEYSYTPTELGVYNYTITATDGGSNTATASGAFTSQDSTDPVANAGPDQTVNVGVVVTFAGSGSTDNDGIVNYTWTFTEGAQTRTLYGAAPTHTFTTVGAYTVTLNVTDASGNWDVDTVTVTVQAAGGGPAAGIEPWVIGLLIAIILAVVVGLALLMRRRKKAAPAQEVPHAPDEGMGASPPDGMGSAPPEDNLSPPQE
jgi:hypothetical protein